MVVQVVRKRTKVSESKNVSWVLLPDCFQVVSMLKLLRFLGFMDWPVPKKLI